MIARRRKRRTSWCGFYGGRGGCNVGKKALVPPPHSPMSNTDRTLNRQASRVNPVCLWPASHSPVSKIRVSPSGVQGQHYLYPMWYLSDTHVQNPAVWLLPNGQSWAAARRNTAWAPPLGKPVSDNVGWGLGMGAVSCAQMILAISQV